MTASAPGAVLARELTEITETIRQVPAPPVPELVPPNGIRVTDPDGTDAELVAEWMNRPHLVTTWEYDWPVARWRNHLRAQVDGAYSRPLILSVKGVDRAYLEIYRAAKDSIARCYDSEAWVVSPSRPSARASRRCRCRPKLDPSTRSRFTNGDNNFGCRRTGGGTPAVFGSQPGDTSEMMFP